MKEKNEEGGLPYQHLDLPSTPLHGRSRAYWGHAQLSCWEHSSQAWATPVSHGPVWGGTIPSIHNTISVKIQEK